jgi:acetyl/propionyl-CoA carboxylase alpha subunit
MKHAFQIDEATYEVWLTKAKGGGYVFHFDALALPVRQNEETFTIAGKPLDARAARIGDRIFVHLDGQSHEVRLLDPVRRHAAGSDADAGRNLQAPMPGAVVAVPVTVGQTVKAGDPVVVIESMKLETTLFATHDSIVEIIHVSVGQSFERGATLISLAGS